MNRYTMFYVQTSTLPPRMYQKLIKHGRFCRKNNQLPTKSHVELKDNSNVVDIAHPLCMMDNNLRNLNLLELEVTFPL
jgi:hypothetical protein